MGNSNISGKNLPGPSKVSLLDLASVFQESVFRSPNPVA